MNINKYFCKEFIFLYISPLFSATFLLLIQALGEPIKNYDGLYYLEQASELLNGSTFHDVFTSKDSFLFPFLIYFLSNSLKIPLLSSVYTLLFISNFFIAHFFFKIYLKFSKFKNNFYVILIFFSFIAYFDNYGPLLLRDHLAWAFFLCAIFYLLRYTLTKNRVDVFLFLLASILGTFFRVELIVISILIFLIVNFYLHFSLKDFFFYFVLVGGFFLVFVGIYGYFRSHDLFTDTRLSLFNLTYIISNFRFDLLYIPKILISFLKNCFFIIPLYLIVIFDKKNLKNNKTLHILNLIIIFSLGLCIFHAMVTDIFTSRYLMFSLFTVYLATVLNFECDTKLKKRYVILTFAISLISASNDSHNKYDELVLYLNDKHESNFYSTNPKINYYLNDKIKFEMNSLNHGDYLIIDKREQSLHESFINQNKTLLFNNSILDRNFIIIQAN